MNCEVGTCGLLLGLIGNQSDLSSAELFRKEFVDKIFTQYKKGIEEHSGKLDSRLYLAKGYYLFGDCNLAVLALYDDFAFPNRVLHPGHGFSTVAGEDAEKYTMQVISGISTVQKGAKIKIPSLEEQADVTFLKPKERFPFICITHYKLNNGLLIGNGVELLELVKQGLYRRREDLKNNYEIELICLDSFSNHELTVVYFAKEMTSIVSFINESRTLQLDYLLNVTDFESLDRIARRSLLFQSLQSNRETSDEEAAAGDVIKWSEQVKAAHVFSTTYSYCGYDMEWDTFPELTKKQRLTLQYHWDLKPGHYTDFEKAVFDDIAIFSRDEVTKRILPGADMVQFVVENTFEQHLRNFESLHNCPGLRSFVRKQRINVIFRELGLETKVLTDEKSHPELLKHLRKCVFHAGELQAIRQDLDALRVSKVLKERTLKMYCTFNDCIADLLFFNYFIELKDYLKGILCRIHEYAGSEEDDISLEQFHVWLDNMIRNFEQAYYNRFHQSSRMRNISDFNLEYNGGIQQYISAYDMTYKTILKGLMLDDFQQNCVYVSGFERVSSDRKTLRINILHVTYPELCASIIWKEAMNFYWSEKENNAKSNLKQINIDRNENLLIQSEFLKLLRIQVQSDRHFRPDCYVHDLMLSALNENLIHYLLADAVVFNAGYGGDFDLVSYWYWVYFVQMSHFYDRKGRMEPAVFVKFLIRWLFIKRFKGTSLSEPEGFFTFDPKLSELFFCYYQEAKDFVDILIRKLECQDFFKYIGGVSAIFVRKLLELPDEMVLTGRLSDKQAKVVKNSLLVCDENMEQKSTAFKNGEVICFDREKENDIMFIHNLIIAYLRQIKELAVRENSSIRILERDSKGQVIGRKTQYQNILADPLGGMFIWDGNRRGEYFRCRAIFYKSLWGFSQLMKKEYVSI